MSNLITWAPSVDSDVVSYKIQDSTSNAGPWTLLAQVSGTVGGANYNNNTGLFFYRDVSGSFTTWYRIIAVDSYDSDSDPSIPFRSDGPTTSFTVGATPFGIYDEDPDFQTDADRIVEFSKKKLGDPVMEVHFENEQGYACFEEACLEFSAMMNSYQAKSLLTSFLGAPTGSLQGSEQKYITQNLEFEKKLAEPYGDSGPLSVNTSLPLYSGSIQLQTGQQKYNLFDLIPTGSDGKRPVIRQIYHFSPLSAYRFFGTTSAVNYLNNQFNFESFTPETIFYLLPIWEDILRGMQFETSNRVRRSNYSYELHNNELTLYPTPTSNVPLWITWQYQPDATRPASFVSGSTTVEDSSYYGVSNLSNVPFGNIDYSKLNSISKQWIRRFSFALIKEVEGQIRSKINTIPIPNGDLTLNGAELIADARQEQDRLREELRAMLEDMTYEKLAQRQAEKAQALEETIKRVPLGIYIGNFWPFLFVPLCLLHEFFNSAMSRM